MARLRRTDLGADELSDYADAITEADAQRLSAVLRESPLLGDPELMRRIRGIRRDYPDDHWWWYPERLIGSR